MKVLQLRKNYSFFCCSRKVSPGDTELYANFGRAGYSRTKKMDFTYKNHILQYEPQSSKSLKSKLFEDSISKRAIRISLSLFVFIFFVDVIKAELRREVMGGNSHIFSGDRIHFFWEA